MDDRPASPPKLVKQVDPPLHGSAFRLQYQYDELETMLSLNDLRFADAMNGMGCGVVYRDDGRKSSLVLVTRDGGKQWTPIKVKDEPASLCILDLAHVWYVGQKDLWFTSDFGTKWTKLDLPKNMGQVFFQDPMNGFAIGLGKIFYRTKDGGKKWEKVPESVALGVSDDNTALNCIVFVSPQVGFIAGTSKKAPPESQLPDWLTPERAMRRKLTPGTSILMTTNDGGATWKGNLTSLFGTVARLRIHGARGASVVSYSDSFHWPSEVAAIDLKTSKAASLFRRKDVNITDVELVGDRGYLLAGIQGPGRLQSEAVMGKLKVYYTADGENWVEIKADYRAEGTSAVITTDHAGHYWIGTNHGAIVKLEA